MTSITFPNSSDTAACWGQANSFSQPQLISNSGDPSLVLDRVAVGVQLHFKVSGVTTGLYGADSAFCAYIINSSTNVVWGVNNTSGNLTSFVASQTLMLKRGSNGKCGTFTANGTASVSVSNTSIAITDVIMISLNTVGGTVGFLPHLTTITAGTGFTVVASASDTSTYNYAIISNAA